MTVISATGLMSWAILLFHCSVFTFIVSYSVTVISATGLMSWAVLLFHCSVFTCIVSYSVTVISASGLMSWAVRTIKVMSQPDHVQQHVDTDGNVTKKHKTM